MTVRDDAIFDPLLELWVLLVHAQSVVARRVEAELVRRHALPLAHFEALCALERAPAHRLRMTELATRVVLSRSGASRAVDRLADRGLVRRRPCDDDLRGTYAELTTEGRVMARAAHHVHAAAVRRHLGALVPPGEAGDLVRALRAGLGPAAG